jgi:hypothetical protein
MIALPDLTRTLARITTPFGAFRMGDDGPALWLQFSLEAPDETSDCTGPVRWRGRKWRISKHSTEREIVGTAFLALTTALEHEARESFRYEGAAVFGPHIPLSWLVRGAFGEPADARARAHVHNDQAEHPMWMGVSP